MRIPEKWLPFHKKLRMGLKATPATLLIFGFLFLIAVGGFLLSLPISSSNRVHTSLLDAFFTATSAVCVTGLVVVDTNLHWSFFGKTIILILIQIGALGIMSVVTLFSVLTGKRLGLTHRLAIQESISNFTMQDIVGTFQGILLVTLSIEGIGAAVTATVLIPRFGFAEGVGKSIFHAVSAFCNAGFDLFGGSESPFSSLTGFAGSPILLLTTAILIIVGGLGFIVWNDIAVNRQTRKFTLHTKIVLLMTVILLLVGTVGFYLMETNGAFSGMSWWQKGINAFFQSVTARTAGFNAVPMDKLYDASALLTILLMFIGAAPGSTGGGLKVTTLFVLMVSLISFVQRKKEVNVFERRIVAEVIVRALAIFMLSGFLVLVTVFVLLLSGVGNFMDALFESVSAFATVGLSRGLTPGLPAVAKGMLMLTMLLGRIGTISVFMSFAGFQDKAGLAFRYPEGKITVG